MGSLWRSLLVLLLALAGAACSRGPDEADLARDVQARLDALFGRPVLVLGDLNRQGSAPFTAAPDGARQAIVYYNATLQFAEAYDPSDWEGLSPQLIASALGATDEGIVGLKAATWHPVRSCARTVRSCTAARTTPGCRATCRPRDRPPDRPQQARPRVRGRPS